VGLGGSTLVLVPISLTDGFSTVKSIQASIGAAN